MSWLSTLEIRHHHHHDYAPTKHVNGPCELCRRGKFDSVYDYYSPCVDVECLGFDETEFWLQTHSKDQVGESE